MRSGECYDPLCEKHNHPKPRKQDAAAPTTGEWTEWTGKRITNFLTQRSAKELAEEINASIAAERAKIWREAPDQPDVQEAVIKKLDLVHRHAIEKAVAAERGNVAGASWYDQEMRQLREQLAAEREKGK